MRDRFMTSGSKCLHVQLISTHISQASLKIFFCPDSGLKCLPLSTVAKRKRRVIVNLIPLYVSESVVLIFHSPMPGATDFSDQATTDRGLVSGYKVWVSMCSVVA